MTSQPKACNRSLLLPSNESQSTVACEKFQPSIVEVKRAMAFHLKVKREKGRERDEDEESNFIDQCEDGEEMMRIEKIVRIHD